MVKRCEKDGEELMTDGEDEESPLAPNQPNDELQKYCTSDVYNFTNTSLP